VTTVLASSRDADGETTMRTRRLSADNLIALAAATLRAEITPSLPADKRYTAAMIANALDIARREVMTDGDEAQWALLDRIYEEGEGSLARLAADIRDGTVSEATHADLAEDLRKLLVAELKITNPKALTSR
jgi:hypothetical protein